MKKFLYFIIPLTLFIIFIVLSWVQPIKNMIYLEDVRIDELAKYRIDSKNDITKFNEISSNLPGNISRSGEGLVWGRDIQASYDYYGGNRSQLKRLERFWQNNKKKILLFNATTYLILVPNAQKVTVELDVPYKQKFEVTRKDLENFYGRDLNEYYANTLIWEKEVIRENINSSQKLKAFFKVHKIEEIK